MRDLLLPLICSLLLAPLALGAEARVAPASPSVPIPTAAHFVPVGNVPGFSGYASVMAQDSNGVLYVGGDSVAAGGTKIVGVARWDGSNWSAVGNLPVAESHFVTALAIAPGGELYASVYERTPTFADVFHVFRWNGTAWTKLLTSTDYFYSLACDSLGRLYLGIQFPGSPQDLPASIMTWDGSAWTPLPGAPNGSVTTMRFDSDGLLVGGGFYEAGGQPAQKVALWDGKQWHSFGSGLIGRARSLAKGPDGKIYAAYFADQFVTGGVAAWDGQQWTPMLEGFVPELHSDIRAISVGPAGQIVIGGEFLLPAGDVILTVAQWDGTRWQPLCHGLLGTSDLYFGSSGLINALAWDTAGRLLVSGRLDQSGIGAKGVAIFENGRFRPLSAGVPSAKRVVPDPSGGAYLAGNFAWVDGRPAGGVAHWDGLRWSTLKGGLIYRSAGGEEPALIWDLVCAPDGKLYVLGGFTHSGEQLMTGQVACWDGQNWSSLGSLPSGQYFAKLAIHPDGSLLAWTYSSGDQDQLLRWDGVQWSVLRDFSGIAGIYSPVLVSSGTRLLVVLPILGSGGTFTAQLHQLEGGNWTDIGTGFNGYVRGACGDTLGNFYVWGDFTSIGPAAMGGLARWDGATWTRVGTFASFGGTRLSAGPDGSIVYGTSHWDGQTWTNLSGFFQRHPTVEEVALDAQGNRWICGEFNVVAGHVSSSLFRLLREPAVATQFTSAVPPATVVQGVPFSHAFTGTGNPLPQFALASGSLPPGLTLTNAGVLSGTPTGGTGQIFQATVRAANSVPGEATQSFSIRVVTRLTSFLESHGLEGGVLAANADPDGDGLANLLEYAFQLNPTVARQPPLSTSLFTASGQTYVSIRFPRSPAATDLDYIVEATGSLGEGAWSEVARSEAGNPFTGPGFVQESAAGDGIDVAVRDTVSIESGAPQRFLRLRVMVAPTRSVGEGSRIKSSRAKLD